MALSLALVLFLSLSSLCCSIAMADSSMCARSDLDFFPNSIRSQCPVQIERSYVEEVTGDTLDIELSNVRANTYYSVFFYASWCPFSRKSRPMFDTLSIMFPQIRHLAVEESSSMPSVFSRYGIHSFPSILIGNGLTGVHYHGSKDLNSLVQSYRKITGLEPHFPVEPLSETENMIALTPWNRPLKEIIISEPYLALSVLFVCLKAVLWIIPAIISRLKALIAVYVWNINLGIFGEWNQLLERVLHVIDLKRLWSKFRLSNKTRNFQKGASNARVWASSLTSVSLGESSSSRSS